MSRANQSMHADLLFYLRPQDIRSLRQEIEILRGLKHEHIIEMSDAFETKSEFCVVTEFAQGELFEARCSAATASKDKRTFQPSSPRFWRTTRIYRRSRFRCRTVPLFGACGKASELLLVPSAGNSAAAG